MQAGFVGAGKGLRWHADKGIHWTVFSGEPIISLMRMRGTPAARCTACGLVLIETKEVA